MPEASTNCLRVIIVVYRYPMKDELIRQKDCQFVIQSVKEPGKNKIPESLEIKLTIVILRLKWDLLNLKYSRKSRTGWLEC